MHSTFGDCDNFLACGQALRAVAIYYGFLRRLFAMLTPDVSGFFAGLPCLQLRRLFALLGSMRGWHRGGFWVPSFGRRPPTHCPAGPHDADQQSRGGTAQTMTMSHSYFAGVSFG